MNSRAGYVQQLAVPAAVLGVIATTITAAPAEAAAVETDSMHVGTDRQPTVLPRVLPTSAAPATYTVQDGDTVFTIAQRYGLRTVDVLTWNGLGWRSVIYPGQTLSLVSPAAPVPAAPAPPAPAASASAPAPAASTHTVVAGDTVFAIAQQYGTSVDAIYALNALTSTSIIYPGQALVVAAAPAPAAAPATAAPPATATPQTAILNAPQSENATMIIRIGRELGVSDRGIAIALATSMVESWLRNLDWGDRDSLGLFQQRPSTGWGTPDQISDRDRSIRVFYGGQSDPNGTTTRGLLDIPGWECMAFQDAAQAVQISAYPERYAQWEAQAYEWIALHG